MGDQWSILGHKVELTHVQLRDFAVGALVYAKSFGRGSLRLPEVINELKGACRLHRRAG